MQLPAALEPWAPWLALLPPDLAETLGDMLLRLHPLVGRLNPATLRSGSEPAGVGNIVRRGHYERLLITEWAYADAEPDEFLRRAGSGELLFTGPEPAMHQRSLESIALFDAGLSQLGEPRLAQVALFILLARRAQQAGARFRWGVWQQPGTLHEVSDASGLKKLIKARTLAAPSDAADQWQTALPPVLQDCWLVGAASLTLPQRTCMRTLIRPALLARQLDITLHQRDTRQELKLDLPDANDCVRLLRLLVASPVPAGVVRQVSHKPSRAQPPRFGMNGQRLAVAQLNGGAMTYHVPSSSGTQPGKSRSEAAPGKGMILAAGLLTPKLSYIRAVDHQLFFHNLPGPLFAGRTLSAPRPEMEQFRAPPGMSRWLPLFFMQQRGQNRVLVLDTKKQLVCWQISSAQPELAFHPVASNVIGIIDFGKTVQFACLEGEGIQLYQWQIWQERPQKFTYVGHQGTHLWFGGKHHSDHSGRMMLAIQRSDTDWWVAYGGDGSVVQIDDGATVLGVAISVRNPNPGLVVLHPGRQRLELRVRGARYELATSTEAIQQASFDAASRRMAWITARTSTVIVRGIDDDQVLLQISAQGDQDAT